MSLTPKQKKVLDYIMDFTRENGYSPSQQEIAKYFDFSSLGTVQNYLVRLQKHGYLQKQWNSKRGMKVLSQESSLPLLGRVAAGKPIEAMLSQENVEVPPAMLRSNGDYFVLQVEGDSMVDDGIFDGDYVVVKKQSTANNKQTVVAMVDNEATIKRYVSKRGFVELHPANPNYEPIVVEKESDFRIEGVLAGVIRHYS